MPRRPRVFIEGALYHVFNRFAYEKMTRTFRLRPKPSTSPFGESARDTSHETGGLRGVSLKIPGSRVQEIKKVKKVPPGTDIDRLISQHTSTMQQ